MQDVMTTSEAAAVLGLKRRQVINLINAGQLEGRRLGPYRGGAWVVTRSSVEALQAVRSSVRSTGREPTEAGSTGHEEAGV